MPQQPPNLLEEEDRVLKTLSGAIVKGILCICVTVLAGIWLHSCQLDAAIIQECRAACSDVDSQLGSVTSGKCVCTKKSSPIDSPWVLP